MTGGGKPPVVIDLMAALEAKPDALPVCPRCKRREARLDYCARCDMDMCRTCHRDHGHEEGTR